MPSNKKKRGKQRKAKQSERQAASVPADSGDAIAGINDRFASAWEDEERYRRSFKSLPAEKFVRDIMMGHVTATNMTLMLSHEEISDVQFMAKLRGAGLVKVVLDLLKNCNDEASIKDASVMPSEWMHILHTADSSECRVEIAEGMGPIIKCLSNDIERKFFGHNQHWIYTYPYYLMVIRNLIRDRVSKEETTNILIEYEGFVESIIHPLFWKSHRPDICKELDAVSHLAPGVPGGRVPGGEDILLSLIQFGFDVICWIIYVKTGGRDELIETIATTLVTSKVYNPECEVVFVEGFIRNILTLPFAEKYRRSAFNLLGVLLQRGFVDKGVIMAAIEYGKDNAASYNDAERITNLFLDILIPHGKIETTGNGELKTKAKRQPIATRYNISIDSGILQVCLNLLTKYETEDGGKLAGNVYDIMNGLSKIAFLKKTSKGLSTQRVYIQEALNELERKHSILIQANLGFSYHCQDPEANYYWKW